MSSTTAPGEGGATARLALSLLGAGLFALGAVAGALYVHLRPLPQLAAPDGGPPRRWEATIFLPTTGNFTDHEWKAAVELLVREFGGATVGDVMQGWWSDATGRVVCEPVRPVIISIEPDRLDRLRQKLQEVGRKLGQKEIYVRYERPRIETLAVKP
jgi:hypothetical protein